MMTPSSSVIRPEATTQPQGDPPFMLKPRKTRMMPEATKRRAENERQPHRGQQRILERGEAGDDVKNSEQKPEDKPPPGLDLERVDDLEDSRDDHHDSDHVNRRHRRHDDAAKSDQRQRRGRPRRGRRSSPIWPLSGARPAGGPSPKADAVLVMASIPDSSRAATGASGPSDALQSAIYHNPF